jgi:hypothetical protein
MRRVALGLITFATACGIGSNDSVDEFTSEELAELSQLSPTTTTTTTTVVGDTTAPADATVQVPDSVPPDSGLIDPPASAATIAPTATTETTDDVELYFVDGSSLVPVKIALAAPVSPRSRLEGLAVGPDTDDLKAGIRTAVPPGLVDGLRISGDRVSVDLDVHVLNTVESPDQLQMVGQIVLTLTGPMGFDEVRFTIGDEPTRVLLGDTSLSEVGEWVARDDYRELLGDGSVVSTVTVGERGGSSSVHVAVASSVM